MLNSVSRIFSSRTTVLLVVFITLIHFFGIDTPRIDANVNQSSDDPCGTMDKNTVARITLILVISLSRQLSRHLLGGTIA